MEIKTSVINETTARRAKEMSSFNDYKTNSATDDYNAEVNRIMKKAECIKEIKPERSEEIDGLVRRYIVLYANFINKSNEISCRCPSVMICGPANFPVRKQEQQFEAYGKNFEKLDQLKSIEYKLERIKYNNEAIKSGDSDAIEKLQSKLQKLDDLQIYMKNANAYYRKNKTLKGYANTTDDSAEVLDKEILTTRHRVPFASFSLTNNNAKIKATKERIEQLSKFKETVVDEVKTETAKNEPFTIVRNTDLVRLQLLFSEKPDEETRSILKRNGFKWAPSQNAWQRLLNNNSEYALKQILKAI